MTPLRLHDIIKASRSLKVTVGCSIWLMEHFDDETAFFLWRIAPARSPPTAETFFLSSMYVFNDKNGNTIINYCEMCFVSIFHCPPAARAKIEQLDGRAHNRHHGITFKNPRVRITASSWIHSAAHPVSKLAHHVILFGDVKCDGTRTVCSGSWLIQLYCRRKGEVLWTLWLLFNIYYL